MKRAINQSLAGDVRVNLDQTNEVSTGLDINFYQSMVGKLPIIPTFAISDDTTTYVGNTVSDIYLVTEKANGQNVLYMSDLYPLGKSRRGSGNLGQRYTFDYFNNGSDGQIPVNELSGPSNYGQLPSGKRSYPGSNRASARMEIEYE